MSKEYNVKLQKKLEDYLEAEGLSQAKAAPILGISAAVLSQYRRSVYDKGDIGEVEKKLEEFFRITGWRSAYRPGAAGRRSPSEPTCRDTSLHPYRKRPTS